MNEIKIEMCKYVYNEFFDLVDACLCLFVEHSKLIQASNRVVINSYSLIVLVYFVTLCAWFSFALLNYIQLQFNGYCIALCYVSKKH